MKLLEVAGISARINRGGFHIGPSRKAASMQTSAARIMDLSGVGETGYKRNYASYFRMYRDLAWFYICVNEIGIASSQPKLRFYKVIGDDEWSELPTNHAACDLDLHPNAFMPRGLFWRTVISYKIIAGNIYLEKQMWPWGGIYSLYPLRPDRMTIVPGGDWIKHYEYATAGKPVIYGPDEIIHIREFNPTSDFYGLGAGQPSTTSANIDYKAQKTNEKLFDQGGIITGGIEFPDDVSSKEKRGIKRAWDAFHKGFEKAHRLLILSHGAKFANYSMDFEKMQFSQLRKMSKEELCAILRVPGEIVGATERKIYNTYSEAQKDFWQRTVMGHLSDIEEWWNTYVCPTFGDDIRCAFDYSEVSALRGDDKVKAEIAKNMTESGVWSPNEARQRLWGMDGFGGGEIHYMPMNLLPVGSDGSDRFASLALSGKDGKPDALSLLLANLSGQKALPSPEGKQGVPMPGEIVDKAERRRRWERYTTVKMAGERSMGRDIEREFKGEITGMIGRLNELASGKDGWKPSGADIADIYGSEERMADELAKLGTAHILKVYGRAGEEEMVTIRRRLPKTANGVAAEGKFKQPQGPEVGFFDMADPKVLEFLRERRLNLKTVAKRNYGAVRQILYDGVAEGLGHREIAERLRDHVKKQSHWRAERIARTEVGKAVNHATLQAMGQSGLVEYKQWLTMQDGRVRDEHAAMEGEKVRLGAVFSNGLEYPQEPNCRCAIVEILASELYES